MFKQNFKGSFEDQYGKTRGYDFGTPRNQMKNTINKSQISADKLINVGPGA